MSKSALNVKRLWISESFQLFEILKMLSAEYVRLDLFCFFVRTKIMCSYTLQFTWCIYVISVTHPPPTPHIPPDCSELDLVIRRSDDYKPVKVNRTESGSLLADSKEKNTKCWKLSFLMACFKGASVKFKSVLLFFVIYLQCCRLRIA